MTDPSIESDAARDPARSASRRGRVAHLAGSMYVVTAVTLVSSPVVARAIGPEGRGEYAAAYVWGLIAFALLGSGVPTAVLHLAGKKEYSEAQLLGASIRFGLLLLLPTIALGAVVALVVLGDLQDGTRLAAFALIMLLPLRVVAQSQRSLLMARGELRPMTIVGVLPALLVALTATTLAVFDALTLDRYLVLTFVIEAAASMVWWLALPVRPAGPVPARPVFAFGIRSQLGYASEFSARRLDQAVLAAVVLPAQLGFYAVAATLATLPAVLGNAVSSRAYGTVEDGSAGLGRPGVAGRIFRELVVASGITAVGIAVVAPVVVPLLWGEPFEASIEPLLLLLPGSIALAVMGLCRNYLIISNRPTAMSAAQLLGAVITVVGLIVLAPTWGIQAAAVVSSASYIAIVAAMLYLLRDQELGRLWPGTGDIRSVYRHGIRLVPFVRRRRSAEVRPR